MRSKQVTWCFTPSQPVRIYQGEAVDKKVTWCFTPSQPVRVYLGEAVDNCTERKKQKTNKQKTLVFYSSLSILFTFHLPIDHRLSSSREFSRAVLFVYVGGVTEGGGGGGNKSFLLIFFQTPHSRPRTPLLCACGPAVAFPQLATVAVVYKDSRWSSWIDSSQPCCYMSKRACIGADRRLCHRFKAPDLGFKTKREQWCTNTSTLSASRLEISVYTFGLIFQR